VKPALVISDRDNVATALEPLDPGRPLELGGRTIVVRELIPSGHKVALVDLAVGQEVIKYGSAIGLATAAIARGTHVHTHNLSSSRGRGDLERPTVPPEPGVRLAEPADERSPAERARAVGGSHD
jgi:altronate dehydratase